MTCQNAADVAAPAYAALGYIGLLSCSVTISRFGRQTRLGEHVDSGLTAYRHSEFATLDKIRLRYRTRLGRFITSPRLACRPPLALPSPQFPHLIQLDTGHNRPASSHNIVSYCMFHSRLRAIASIKAKIKNSLRNILKLILLRFKKA